jgi:RNase P/RNase MRP subunit p30
MKQVLIQSKNFDLAIKKIRESKGKEIIFSSDNDELNRKVMEKEPIDTLLINQRNRKDRMKQRDSGFNQVLAKIAKKKNISIGIDFDELMVSRGKSKSEILGRINQNVMLCNKNKLKMVFISRAEKDSHDLKALGAVLGMPTWMLK